MASWQYDLHLVPRLMLMKTFGHIPDSLEPEVFDSIDWWADNQPPADYQEVASSLLNESASWNINLRVWGEGDGNRLDVFSERGDVRDVFIRVDVRNLDPAFLKQVARFADHCRCLLLTADMAVLEPTVELLRSAIKQSRAFSFVSNPHRFLEDLREERIPN